MGKKLIVTSPGTNLDAPSSPSNIAKTLRCVMIAPLGGPVVPLV
jgi:hypothetical protein